MSELEYGINVANKFDLLFGDDDPSEILSKAGDAKKKKADPKAAAPAGNVLKEKTATGKPGDKKVEAGKDAKKPGQQQQQQGGAKAPAAGGQQQGGQRPPRSAPQGGRPEQGGKENSDAQRRPPQQKTGGDQQRSPAAAGGQQQGGPRRFGGPRPEGSAPPRRPMGDDFGGSSGPMTGGDQEVPEQRTGFGGGRGFRGGASGFRGGRASPRHQYPPREGGAEGGAPSHARGREYERHSGSNKTGVKPTQKREGGGSHNWGSYRDDAALGAEAAHAPEGGAAPASAEKPAHGEEGAAEAVHVEGAEGAAAETEPAEPHEKTLKEWMEEEERNRLRPKYATRQANEGEPEQKVFQKMKRVQRESAGADGMVEVVEYVEVDVDEDSHVPTGASKSAKGGPFQLVFAPAARPEGGFREGGRGRGGPRGGRGGERGGRGRGGYQGGPNQGGHHRGQAPPKQDELNFPPLG